MDNLIKAYQETNFKVYEPPITIKIGENNSILDELLRINSTVNWAYITAWNPYSELTSLSVNEQRNHELKSDLYQYLIFKGEGVGTDPDWVPEQSFLVLGITREDAIKIGKIYRQNAIVVGSLQSVAELVWIK